MIKKILSIVFAGGLLILTCFPQTAAVPAMKTQTKMSRADLLRTVSAKPDFEKELYKSTAQKEKQLSSGKKTALWIGLIAAGVVTVVILVSRDDDDRLSPCGVRPIMAPRPPGCVCTQ